MRAMILVRVRGVAWEEMGRKRGECGVWVGGGDESTMMQLRQRCQGSRYCEEGGSAGAGRERGVDGGGAAKERASGRGRGR